MITSAPSGSSPLDRLAKFRRWIPWQEGPRHEGGPLTKIPRLRNGRNGDLTNPENWYLRCEAEQAAGGFSGPGRRGVCVLVGEVTERWALCAFDLDACVDHVGTLLPWATEIVDFAKSYCETTPSGQGLRILFGYPTADLRTLVDRFGAAKRVWFQAPQDNSGPGKRPAIELHLARGYVTITGWQRPDSADHIAEVSRDRLEALIVVLDGRESFNRGRRAEPGERQAESHGTRVSSRPILGAVDSAGFLRVEPAALEWAACHLADIPLQVDVALAAAAGRQARSQCIAVMPFSRMCALPGLRGRPRSRAGVTRALAALEAAGRQRVIRKPLRPRYGKPGIVAAREILWLHTFNPTRDVRQKLRISRNLMRSVAELDDAARRLLLLLLARYGLAPGEPFVVSARALAAEIALTLEGKRPPKPDKLRRGCRDLVQRGFLLSVKQSSGRSAGKFGFGARIYGDATPI